MTMGLVEIRFVANLDAHEVVSKNLIRILSNGEPRSSVVNEEGNTWKGLLRKIHLSSMYTYQRTSGR